MISQHADAEAHQSLLNAVQEAVVRRAEHLVANPEHLATMVCSSRSNK